MPNPNAFQFQAFDCTALDVIVRGGFRTLTGGVETDYCGLRSVYAADESSWSEDDTGFWKSGAASQAISTGITLQGSVALERLKATQRDTILRVASGSAVVALWGILYGAGTLPCRVRVWSCATGALAYNATSSTGSAVVGELADGSYTLGVAIEGAAPKHMTRQEYATLTGESVDEEYFYTEGGASFFYDYRKNLGVRPSDPQDALNILRAEVETAGTREDNAAWIHYATSHDTYNSQWAMIPFIVGIGAWERAAGVLAAPDCALVAAATSEATQTVTPANLSTYQVAFDPFARSVASHLKSTEGTEYIGGERSCADGTETALWQLHGDGSATLLGTSRNFSTGMCECGGLQQAHEARRIVEDWNGDIIVQTLCSLLRYDPHGETVEQKLVPHPRQTDGHPGGRSLLVNGKSLCETTEHFGEKNDGEPAGQFYDTFITRSNEIGSASGIGTSAHVDGNLALSRGRVWAVIQNKLDYTHEDAVQSVAFMSPAGWQKTGRDYPANEYQLQRVARIGWHLVTTGKERNSENPLFRSSDGYIVEFGESTYRLRQIDAVMNSTGFETGLAPGFLPTDNFDGKRYPRRLIEIGDRATGRILDSEPNPTENVDAGNAQEQSEVFGPGAVWFGEPLQVWGSREVSGVTVIDVMPPSAPSAERPFEAYFKTMLAAGDALIWARVDSVEDVENLSSYIYPVPVLSDLWMLPITAKSKVEFVVVLPASADSIEPMRLLGVC